MVIHHHKQKHQIVKCMILTVSDTRTMGTDKSGQLIEQYLTDHDHRVIAREIVQDEQLEIKKVVQAGCTNEEIDAIILTGGTGIAYRDVTIETITAFFDKEIPGFGEIFRMLSYQEDIGSAAMMSRAVAGVSNHTAIFSLPGSSGAVRLAMEKLILPELAHVVNEVKKDLK
ncbi:molybdenum cofactor biosynthesis protein B [Virgibacillus soli]|uniref:MogA/MoaB family molybdenum cofactor biosynthesis protein n=1 Tax=Paracerasibacillus soli TaxID=480284 RepID=UPI0035EE35BF